MSRVEALVKIMGESGILERRLLVDTGSTYTWINGSQLTKIGMNPVREHEFITIQGKRIRRRVGWAQIEVLDRRGHTLVVFGEPGDKEVLGMHALEGLALEPDPVSGKLKPVEAILAV